MNTFRRLACLCTVCLLLSSTAAAMPAAVFAVSAESDFTVQPGETHFASFDHNTGNLLIGGTAPVTDLASELDYVDEVLAVKFYTDVTVIGENALAGFPNLKTVTVPKNITQIGENAFADCPQLETVIINSTDCEIFDSPLTFSSSDTAPYFTGIIRGYENSTAQAYTEQYGYNFEIIPPRPENVPAGMEFALFDDHAVITGWDNSAETVEIPEEIYGLPVTEIGDSAFYMCDALTEIVIPPTVTSIGADACSGTSLTELILPPSVTHIGAEAFSITPLTSIYLPESVTKIDDMAFFLCYELTEISLPGSVTELGEGVFTDCISLERVWLPDSLTVIPDGTFAECTALTEIEIPASVAEIGKEAFAACDVLERVTILNPDCVIYDEPGTISNIHRSADWGGVDENEYHGVICGYENSTAQTYTEKYGYRFALLPAHSADVPAGLEYTLLEDHAVITGWDNSAKKLEIPAEISGLPVTEIGERAFALCTGLTAVTIPESVRTIGAGAFSNTGLTAITIPDGVTRISYSTFHACYDLAEVRIPESVTAIEDNAFMYCTALKNIQIPASVTEIGDYAFTFCGLTDITIPVGTEKIGRYTFWGCDALTDAVISESVTQIGESAFVDCTNLERITIENPTCSIFESGATICNQELPDCMFNGIIFGHANSTAQSYAEQFERSFRIIGEEPVLETGDVDGNGTVDSTDAQLTLSAYLETIIGKPLGMNSAQIAAADIDGDQAITSADAQLILVYYLRNSVAKIPTTWAQLRGESAANEL